jgi:hypothetical protein
MKCFGYQININKGSYFYWHLHLAKDIAKDVEVSLHKMEQSKAGEKCFCCSQTKGLNWIGSYSYCPKHMDFPSKRDAKWNPRTPRGHAYLRKHRLKRKNMAPETVPIVALLLDNADTFAKTQNIGANQRSFTVRKSNCLGHGV